MLRKFRDMKFLLAFLLILTWLIVAGFGYFYYAMNQKELAVKNTKIEELNTNLTQIGELITAYTVTAEVKAGQEIKDTDLTSIQVPVTMATNLVQDLGEIEGKYYRLDMTAGTALSKDAVFENELTDDTRLFDVVLHSTPVGLKVGTFVDVRISLPLGEDFIAIPHKKVHAINGGVIKLAVTEEDIHAYNSMLVDSLLYPGTQMYAVEYLEGGVQKKADAYYPMSKNILSIAQKDPNLLSAIKSDILKRRTALEKGLSALETDSPSDTPDESLDKVLERGRAEYQQNVADAQQEHQIKAAQQAELDAQQAAADAAAAAAATQQ